jgi:predicted ABC-class ATPase
METLACLTDRLHRLDRRGYPAYKGIRGAYVTGERPVFTLVVDHVQGDPFAEPSRLRAIVPPDSARLPEWALVTEARRTATADFLNRTLHEVLLDVSARRGSGHGGELRVLRPGQEVLERSAVRVGPDGTVEARFRAGLPAHGRSIMGGAAAEMLGRDVPEAVRRSLVCHALDASALRRHVEVVEDARALRAQLSGRGLVAFVADGSSLPRRTGADDRPLAADRAVPFRSPESLRVVLEAPNAGDVPGMGIPVGVTLVAGGGFHGKSTLLEAIERGVYDHIPGDGRERVVTVPGAVKVRAEDGRAVAGTDIANFVDRIPGGGDTHAFVTQNASGSTSQAAAIVEALEVGATCLLLDEDTSATNLLIRDARMQALVPDELEPITPFIDRARNLHRDLGVSSILVVGGSGDYLDVADTVIAMREFEPYDVTADARRIVEELPGTRRSRPAPWQAIRGRIPVPESVDPSKGPRAVHVKAFSEERVLFGTEEVSLAGVSQVVEVAQLRAMAQALAWAVSPAGSAIDGRRAVRPALERVMAALAERGPDAFQSEPVGELAAFRIFELAAFLDRLRSLRVRLTR